MSIAKFWAGMLLATALFTAAAADEVVDVTEKGSVRALTLTEGLRYPWALAFLPDARMLVTEREGRLQLLSATGQKLGQVKGLPEIAAGGQGGLLDVLVHPDFAMNRVLYFSYVAEDIDGRGTEVARAELHGQTLRNRQVIFRLQPKSTGGRHFGSRLLHDGRGHLYITLGDRGDRPRAQDVTDAAGSVIRLRDDGTVPDDNPVFAQKDAVPGLFSVGHRNIQGAFIHPKTGDVWLHEHGPQGGDELNIAEAGKNYGWPVITYGVNYVIGTRIVEGTHKPGMEQPLYYWVPSIAPSGMTYYTGDKLPQWRGDLLVGSLKFRTLVRLEVQGREVVHEERLFTDELGRIRDVRTGPDGYVYVLTDARNGKLVRLEAVASE
ncbi:MAG TPA: glucose dehydrogenase [Gammaproteobacteria bacterium]|nr:glucose dehydrogenase [Gammaproteobacteria bacterium]